MFESTATTLPSKPKHSRQPRFWNFSPVTSRHCVDNALLPFGSRPTGHVWVHSRCWSAWYARRKVEAVAALAGLGIMPPAGVPDGPKEKRTQ
jgi:hypothetical protein